MIKSSSAKKPLHLIYVMSIFFVLHMVLPVYIISTFLSEYVSENTVGLIYTLGSILTIVGVLLSSRGVRRFGNYRTILALVLAEVATLTFLVVFRDFIFVLPAILLHLTLATVIAFNLDLFIEQFSSDSETGEVRGTYLSFNNLAWVIAPLLAGFLLTDSDYWKIFLAALIFLIPMLVILIAQFKGFKDPAYTRVRFFTSLSHVWRQSDIRNVFIANLILQTFFAWMVIYIPLYLHEHIGLPFSQIGIILTIMLSAYVILEYPLGRLADSTYGEVELLTGGFLIIGVTTIFLSTTVVSSVLWWGVALFATRIGAAMVEVMSETYFFKKISGADAGDLSIFRMTRPLGYLIAPTIASIFLSFFDLRYLFVLSGVIALSGMYFALKLHDTR